ncbi:ABC transporter ATP-binding protein, partial [Maribellus luteus]
MPALRGFTMHLTEGGMVSLVGRNGAGKTTFFNVITGLYTPDAGEFVLGGTPYQPTAVHEVAKAGIARTFQNIRIFKEMTLLENVVVGMHRHLDYGAPGLLLSLPKYRAAERRARDRALELLSWVKLDHKAHDIA